MKKDLEFTMQVREKCDRCYRPGKFCVCEHLTPFKPRSKIILLMHPMEFKKEKLGTGRLTKASLEESEIIMGIDFTDDKRVNELIQDERYYPLVLYPGEDSINITTPKSGEVDLLKSKIPLIFAIDGTWPCAKKMMTLSKNINSLPRISFTTDMTSQFMIKHQPHKQALSTIESIYVLLKDMHKSGIEKLDGREEGMLESFKGMVKKQVNCATDPNIPSYRGKKFDREPREMVREKKNRSFILKTPAASLSKD